MPRKIWFGYMVNSYEGRGTPGIYYDDLPNEKNYLHAKFLAPPVLLPETTPLDERGEVALSFAELKTLYPPPDHTPSDKVPLVFTNILDALGV